MGSQPSDLANRLAACLGLDGSPSRRRFLRMSSGGVAGLSALAVLGPISFGDAYVILENAEGLLVSDPTRCVGCRRCELACTEYQDGRAQPSLARIKVGRNHNFGPRGQQQGMGRGAGEYGNLRIIQDTCKQCPHPVPCSTACAYGAITLDPKTKARRVDATKCEGCRLCLRACPWEMMSFDATSEKATKCHLCGGRPVCVEACPAAALQYVSWRDLTRAVPIRQAPLPITRDMGAAGCTSCHKPRR